MTAGALAATTVVQLTPGPDPGPEELIVFWPLLVRLGWFLLGFLAVVLVGWLLVRPVLKRAVRRRNRNNPTLQAAVVLYFRLGVMLVGTLVGVAVAGYGGFLNGSALVVSAVALAVGIAAREVIGSLVSGVALVLDSDPLLDRRPDPRRRLRGAVGVRAGGQRPPRSGGIDIAPAAELDLTGRIGLDDAPLRD